MILVNNLNFHTVKLIKIDIEYLKVANFVTTKITLITVISKRTKSKRNYVKKNLKKTMYCNP